MSAKRHIPRWESPDHLGQPVPAGALSEVIVELHREAEVLGEGFDRLDAAQIGTGEHCLNGRVLEKNGEGVGLALAGPGEGSKPIVAFPLPSIACLCVTNQVGGHWPLSISR